MSAATAAGEAILAHRHGHDAGRHRDRHAATAIARGERRWAAGYRHGETLLPAIERLLGEHGPAAGRGSAAIVVGTGPGRVHRAAGRASRPRRGSPTRWASRSSASRRRTRSLPPHARSMVGDGPCVLLLPAGPSDRVARPRRASRRGLLPAATSPSSTRRDVLVAVDLDGRAPAEALARGESARDGPGRARSLRLGAARLAAGDVDDLARLVPEYVTLPRGVAPRRAGRWHGRTTPGEAPRSSRCGSRTSRPSTPIERASFTAPWPPNAYRSELETNRLAHYLVGAGRATRSSRYGGMWLMVDEAHITTFAVHPAWRRQRIGERLLLAFLDLAIDRHAREATLEVRLSNLAARRLYEKYGFRPVGLRPRYYSDDGEDALIMTTEPLAEPAHARADRRACARSSTPRRAPDRARRPAGDRQGADEPTGRPGRRRRRRGRERAAGARRRVVAATRPASRSSRAGGGSTRNVVAEPGRAPRADGRDRARGRGAGPPALDRAGPRRGAGPTPA